MTAAAPWWFVLFFWVAIYIYGGTPWLLIILGLLMCIMGVLMVLFAISGWEKK